MEKKEAMKILKDFHDKSALFSVRTSLDTVIPELKEIEDERMRAMAIKAVYAPEAQSCIKSWGINPEDVIAWLEKQGEQSKQHLYDIIIALWNLLDKIDTFSDLQIDDTNSYNPFRKIEHITQERHKFVKSDGYNLYIKGEQITDFKQGEQKPFDYENVSIQQKDFAPKTKYEINKL